MTKKIRKILNKYDLEGLLACGCPEDEYEHEAVMISERLHPAIRKTELADIVDSVFRKQFDNLSNYPYSELIAIATEILDETSTDS